MITVIHVEFLNEVGVADQQWPFSFAPGCWKFPMASWIAVKCRYFVDPAILVGNSHHALKITLVEVSFTKLKYYTYWVSAFGIPWFQYLMSSDDIQDLTGLVFRHHYWMHQLMKLSTFVSHIWYFAFFDQPEQKVWFLRLYLLFS